MKEPHHLGLEYQLIVVRECWMVTRMFYLPENRQYVLTYIGSHITRLDLLDVELLSIVQGSAFSCMD